MRATFNGKTYELNFFPPRPYQEEAVKAWEKHDYLGAIQLPTGAGKTFVALLAWKELGFPKMVIVVPTNALKQSHVHELTEVIGVPRELVCTSPRPDCWIIILTYQMLTINPELVDKLIDWGFHLWVVDESHHVAGEKFFERVFRRAKERKIKLLGLSATPHGGGYYKEELPRELPVVYRRNLKEIKEFLAPLYLYLVRCRMSPEAEEEYEKAYNEYKKLQQYFLRNYGTLNTKKILYQNPGEQRAVSKYYRVFNTIRTLTAFVPSKDEAVIKILKEFPDEKAIVFSERQDQLIKLFKELVEQGIPAYPLVGKLVRSKKKEKEILDAFRGGKIRVLGLVKKGGEGVNIPDASIGIIVSTAKNDRTNIQRVGRLIRKKPGKVARVFYLYIPHTEEEEIAQKLVRILHPDRVFRTECNDPTGGEGTTMEAEEKPEVREEKNEYCEALDYLSGRLLKVEEVLKMAEEKLRKLKSSVRPNNLLDWAEKSKELQRWSFILETARRELKAGELIRNYLKARCNNEDVDEKAFRRTLAKIGASEDELKVILNGYLKLIPKPISLNLEGWLNAERRTEGD